MAALSLNELFSHCLTPAGSGVHTVNTGKDKRERLQQMLYGSHEPKTVRHAWHENIQLLTDTPNPMLLGICSDSGGGILRGANWGPLAIRDGIYPKLQNQLFDLGDIRVIPHLLHDSLLNEQTIQDCRLALYGDSTLPLPVSPLSITETVLANLYENYPDARLLHLGGDHSVSYACVKPLLEKQKKRQQRTAILHFDAHTDLMDRRLGIEYNFATWAYKILPFLESPADLIQVGIRSSGKDKAYWEDNTGVQQFWADEILAQGAEHISRLINNYIQKNHFDALYISFDVDAIDNQYMGKTGTPEPNGITPEMASQIIDNVTAALPVIGADIMEVAPYTGTPGPIDNSIVIACDIAEQLITKMRTG